MRLQRGGDGAVSNTEFLEWIKAGSRALKTGASPQQPATVEPSPYLLKDPCFVNLSLFNDPCWSLFDGPNGL